MDGQPMLLRSDIAKSITIYGKVDNVSSLTPLPINLILKTSQLDHDPTHLISINYKLSYQQLY